MKLISSHQALAPNKSPYYDQRRANQRVLYKWIKSAMIDFKGTDQVNVPLAEHLSYQLSKNMSEEIKLAEPRKPVAELPARGASINWPGIGCLSLVILFFGALIYFTIFGG